MPLFAFTNRDGGNITGSIMLTNVTLDTTLLPALANLGGMSINATLENVAGTSGPTVTGSPNTFVTFIGGGVPVPGQNTSTEGQGNGSVNDGVFGRTSAMGIKSLDADLALGSGYSLFANSVLPAAPSCPVSAGGSVPVGNITYFYVPIWPNGSEGRRSATCTAVTSSGNQTVTVSWPDVLGVFGYNVYRSGTLVNTSGCSTPQFGALTHAYKDTYSFTCGPSAPSSASGGPSGINKTGLWAPQLYLSATTVAALPAAGATNAGQWRTVSDSSAVTTEGQTCVGGGSERAAAYSNGVVWKCF